MVGAKPCGPWIDSALSTVFLNPTNSMKITDHIAEAKGKTLFSFEVIPPVKGKNIKELYDNIDPLMDFTPPFIDVTTSREEYVYIAKNGLLDKKKTRMRPGTVGICAAIQHKYGVDTVPHLLCGGFTKEETEYVLVDCHYLGIDNVMALRGDAMKDERYFTPTTGGMPMPKALWDRFAKCAMANIFMKRLPRRTVRIFV